MKIKWVKKANKWVVTWFSTSKAKSQEKIQHQNWFGTENEAIEFVKKKQNEQQ